MDFWNNFWKKSFYERKYRLGLHLIFWLFFYFLFSFWDYFLLKTTGNWVGKNLLILFAISMLANMITICLGYYITVATSYRFLVKKSYGWFFLMLILDIIIFCILLSVFRGLMNYIITHMGLKPDHQSDSAIPKQFQSGIFYLIEMVISYFALICLPLAAKFFRDQLRHQKRESELQNKNLQLQMDFLKAQIHPHFLFNTLNNIYSLNLNQETTKSSEMISRLSSLLRYVLYKGKTEFILLEDELEMIEDFIDLEAIRSDNLDLEIQLPKGNINPIYLPPFLLLPLVENAFKHGVNSQISRSFIQIAVTLSDSFITLSVKNSFEADYRKQNVGGLGLANLRQRLDYYYPNVYSLSANEENNQFTAILKLPVLCPKYNA